MNQQHNASQPVSGSTIVVRALIDPVVEAHGFTPTSHYVEACWLPILGPSAVVAYRRLGLLVEARPEGIAVELVDLARSLGLGEGLGKNSLMMRTLERLVRFGVARWEGDALAVRRRLAPVPERQVAARLSASAARAHAHLTRRPRS